MGDRILTRREFTRESVLALLSGVVITISGCSGSSTSADGGGNSDGVNGAVSANHGHTAFVSNVQIMTDNAIVLDIRGNADHPHSIDLSASDLMQIGNRGRVSKTSTFSQTGGFGNHNHTVTFN